MADTKISDLPTDIVALADGDKFPVADASALTADTYATALELKTYVLSDVSLIRASTSRALTSTTASQALFASPSILTLTAGSYLVEGIISISSMSATSGNALFDIRGSGSANLLSSIINAIGIDGAGAAASQTGTWAISTTATAASMVTATTGTSMFASINMVATFDTDGSIIPSISLVTAASAILAAGSYLKITRLGTTTLTNIGNWS